MNNPSNAPTADLSQAGASHDTYVPKMLEMKGRIGRVRYIGYTIGATLLIGLCMAAVMGLLTAIIGEQAALFALLLYVPMILVRLVIAARRFNDLGQSGWLCLLTLIPFVNFFIGLWLIFGPGNPQPNQYGLPPSRNTTAVVWLACLLPLFALLGILAAVAIPAYGSYKAKAALESIKPPVTAPQQ